VEFVEGEHGKGQATYKSRDQVERLIESKQAREDVGGSRVNLTIYGEVLSNVR